MPIYEYRCLDCDHEFERMQKFSDSPLKTCPVCEGTVQKLISRSAFHLKGDGWYVTDYARKSGNHNGESESTSTTETSSSSSSSDNSKSDGGSASSKSSESSSTSTTTSSSSS